MGKIEQLTEELKKVLYSDVYKFEIDTEDFVFGFKKTLKRQTRILPNAINLKAKLYKDCGRFLSDTVRIVAVRFYKNGELTRELIADRIN